MPDPPCRNFQNDRWRSHPPFCDTSFFYACFDQHDVNHEQAKDLSEDAVRSGSRLYVTWDIISETLTLLRYRRSYREALTFLTEIKPHLHIVNYSGACAPKRSKYSAAMVATINFLSPMRSLVRGCNHARSSKQIPNEIPSDLEFSISQNFAI